MPLPGGELLIPRVVTYPMVGSGDAVQVLPANPNRVSLSISNGVGGSTTTFRLDGLGGAFFLFTIQANTIERFYWSRDGHLVGGSVWIIDNILGGLVYFYELVYAG